MPLVEKINIDEQQLAGDKNIYPDPLYSSKQLEIDRLNRN